MKETKNNDSMYTKQTSWTKVTYYEPVEVSYTASTNPINQNTCTMSPSFTEPKTVSDCQEYCCSKCGEYTLIEICFGEDEKPKFCSNCGAKVID